MPSTTDLSGVSCTSRAGRGPVDFAAYDNLESMPLMGLGLALAGGSSSEEFAAAIRATTLPPAIDIGLRFPDFPIGGSLNILGLLFETWEDYDPLGDAPDGDCLAPWHQDTYLKLARLIPLVYLPGTGDDWVAVEHFSLLIHHVAANRIDVHSLPAVEKWPCPSMESRPYRRPRVRGDVTPDHIEEFAAGFPRLASALNAAIGWTNRRAGRSARAAVANSIASRLLGIGVDLRVGSLVSGREIDELALIAEGEVEGASDDSLSVRIMDNFRNRLCTVANPAMRPRDDNLLGAAWSCAVDALLSPRTVPPAR